MTKKKYTPISCAFHSELEWRALRRVRCLVRYRDAQHREYCMRVRIEELFTRSGEEFVLFDNGMQLRLDYLIAVDELYLDEYPPC